MPGPGWFGQVYKFQRSRHLGYYNAGTYEVVEEELRAFPGFDTSAVHEEMVSKRFRISVRYHWAVVHVRRSEISEYAVTVAHDVNLDRLQLYRIGS